MVAEQPEVMAERLNRVQNKLDLLLANVQTGAAKTVLHEEDKYWINVQRRLRFLGRASDFFGPANGLAFATSISTGRTASSRRS